MRCFFKIYKPMLHAKLFNQFLGASPSNVCFEKVLWVNLLYILIYAYYYSLSRISTDVFREAKSIPGR